MTIMTKMTSVFKRLTFPVSHSVYVWGLGGGRYTHKEVQLSVGVRQGYQIGRAQVRGVWELPDLGTGKAKPRSST